MAKHQLQILQLAVIERKTKPGASVQGVKKGQVGHDSIGSVASLL